MRYRDITSPAMIYHATDWFDVIIEENVIKANTELTFGDKTLKGICVTRDMRFARMYASCILCLDYRKLRQSFRVIPRAEAGAYDLANEHGDYRIEAEEFVVCPGIDLSRFLVGVWLTEEGSGREEADIARNHPLFKGVLPQI